MNYPHMPRKTAQPRYLLNRRGLSAISGLIDSIAADWHSSCNTFYVWNWNRRNEI